MSTNKKDRLIPHGNRLFISRASDNKIIADNIDTVKRLLMFTYSPEMLAHLKTLVQHMHNGNYPAINNMLPRITKTINKIEGR